MDLEGFVRRRILKGSKREEVVRALTEILGEFKDWEESLKEDFSEAIFEEVSATLKITDIRDPFLKRILEYPKSGVSMGEYGVGSRGEGDLRVHRDIADLIGEGSALVGPKDQDDAGVIVSEGRYITVAVDGIHSRLSEYPFLAGFHAARAALRDIYVMGSIPAAMISDLHLADDGDIGKIYDFTAGISTVADLTGVPVVSGSTLRVGGDMVFGERLVAAAGAIGTSDLPPLARRNAEKDDVILLTLGKGGGTIATTALFSGNFEIVLETLNVDFGRIMDLMHKEGLLGRVHGMTDVTNGGLRGDSFEISKVSKHRLVLDEKEVKKSVSEKVLMLLENQGIDYLGVSTDSLMLILPSDDAMIIKKALQKDTPIFEVGYIDSGKGVSIIREDGSEEEIRPMFRESPYTKVKKVVGEAKPSRLEDMERYLDRAKKEAAEKKREVTSWIARE